MTTENISAFHLPVTIQYDAPPFDSMSIEVDEIVTDDNGNATFCGTVKSGGTTNRALGHEHFQDRSFERFYFFVPFREVLPTFKRRQFTKQPTF